MTHHYKMVLTYHRQEEKLASFVHGTKAVTIKGLLPDTTRVIFTDPQLPYLLTEVGSYLTKAEQRGLNHYEEHLGRAYPEASEEE